MASNLWQIYLCINLEFAPRPFRFLLEFSQHVAAVIIDGRGAFLCGCQ